jgi:hypothetical protein
LDALRRADGPLTTVEIVASIIKAKGLPDNLAQTLTEKTLAYPWTKLATGSVIKTGRTQGARWRWRIEANPLRLRKSSH